LPIVIHAPRRFRFAALATLGLAATAVAAHADLVLPRPSPGAAAKQTIGLTDLSVSYSRPGVKDRVIWGGLVPYDKPWRTGANEATTLTTTGEITVAGQKLAAGTWSLFTIPGRNEWTFCFTAQKNPFGDSIAFDPKQVVARVTAKPQAGQPAEEWMKLGFENLTTQGAELALRWEKLRVAVPITVDVNGPVLSACRAAVDSAKADDWRTPLRAAAWAFDNGVALPDARAWLDRSLAISKQHGNLALQARWLMKDGKKAEAIATAKDAITAGKAATPPADTVPTEKLLAEWSGGKAKS
jgi:hypothetical protein